MIVYLQDFNLFIKKLLFLVNISFNIEGGGGGGGRVCGCVWVQVVCSSEGPKNIEMVYFMRN